MKVDQERARYVFDRQRDEIDRLRAEVEELRAANSKLHRRAQRAEGLLKKIKNARQSYGRAQCEQSIRMAVLGRKVCALFDEDAKLGEKR